MDNVTRDNTVPWNLHILDLYVPFTNRKTHQAISATFMICCTLALCLNLFLLCISPLFFIHSSGDLGVTGKASIYWLSVIVLQKVMVSHLPQVYDVSGQHIPIVLLGTLFQDISSGMMKKLTIYFHPRVTSKFSGTMKPSCFLLFCFAAQFPCNEVLRPCST